MINWVFFPQSDQPTDMVVKVVRVFKEVANDIDSSTHKKQESNTVLSKMVPGLSSLGFKVEGGKKAKQKITVPVLFGRNGSIEKAFDADAFHETENFVVEVEAGRGVTNYQFLKDLFQACMMHDIKYLGIAVRNKYRNSQDFEKVVMFFDTLYKSNRMRLPLNGVLIIGY